MIKNYLRTALRNLRKAPGYAALNAGGLALGMTCCLLIGLWVQHERSYDRFHPRAEDIYRVALERRTPEGVEAFATTPPPLAQALVQAFPEVERATRLWKDPTGPMAVRYEDRRFFEDQVLFADADVFQVFGFPLLHGDPATALAEPFTIVVTASTARRYFGDEDPVGKTLVLREPSDRDLFEYRVTGVVADLPAHSHIDFDFLASFVTQRRSGSPNWLADGIYTYVVLRPGADPGVLEARLPDLVATQVAPQLEAAFGVTAEAYREAGNDLRYLLQPLTDIHLRSALRRELQPNGSAAMVRLFTGIALVVLLIACVNFMNMTTARSASRAREVGVRKALGAPRRQLVAQFLGESVLMSLLALLLALGLTRLTLPFFAAIAGKPLALQAETGGGTVLILLGFALATGLLAGSYPAFHLSALPATAALRRLTGRRIRSRLRSGLIVFQFAASIVLMIATAVIYQQIRYMLDKDLGFAREQVVVIRGAEVLGPQGETFREQARALPGVARISNAEMLPGDDFGTASFQVAGAPADSLVRLHFTYAGFDFAETMGLALVAGRTLSRDRPEDSLAVLLNASAVRALGLREPVGRQLVWPGESTYTIVGIVEDFHYTSLHRPIEPFALLGPDPRNTNRPNLLITARLHPGAVPATLAELERLWHRFAPQQPFAYAFLDADLAHLYRSEQTTGRLVGAFSVLAVLIACLGLFGLAAFSAAQRTKEIGVRKVFGAGVAGIVVLLSTDFLKLVAVGFVLAAPLAYVALQHWLAGFAYHVRPGPGTFLLAGILALGIAFVTVSYQAAKAALADPIESLRYE